MYIIGLPTCSNQLRRFGKYFQAKIMGEVKPIKMDNWTPSDASTLFADGERVLCFHGPLIYEAKVLKTKPESSPVEYYIHYAGWSKNWDEWVPESRVLKYNDDNVKRQKELARLHGERSKKDNKKGSAKAKKMEQVGNESRASTPSKDGNTSLPLSGMNSSSSGTASTPAATAPATAKSESNSSSSSTTTTHTTNTTTSSSNSSTTTTTSTSSRSNRKSTQASARPNTPSAAGAGDKKDDTAIAAETTEDELPTPAPPKTKRMSSQNSNSELQRTASLTGVAADASTTAATTTIHQPTATTTTAATAGAATTTTTTTSTTEAPCVESEETYTAKLEVKIKIPDELKHYLTDDWYAVVREHKLVELPAKVTVQQITEQYLAHKKLARTTSASKEVAINDVLDGIMEYFNVMLGSQLLYKFERTQYADIMQKHPDTPLSDLYGSFHLLRLFVRLGSMLSYSALDQPAMQTLLVHLHDFLKFLVKNSAVYFTMANFINVDPEYVRNAQ
ncbi:nuA4 complex subunit EAF3 homolog [Drosophila grimshawi]|uniref:nuA4 complex subunit EAF3 homolog n=1 Tax=Drosophila grimshawi TaxID=7222 RepID=UPI0013EF4478|nr:nuA4 complex subunit EAF3 homolog [Drosophila grimshawi]